MKRGIEFEQGMWGVKAVIGTAWSDSMLHELRENDIRELELNSGKGWKGSNVDFLEKLPELRGLRILDLTLRSVQPIHRLHDLVELGLSTYAKTPVNFHSFPNLEVCDFEWIRGSDSLFDSKLLRRLGLNRYANNRSDGFANLINLERLTLLNSSIEDLNGIVKLTALTYLSLANLKKLTSISGIDDLKNLEALEIQHCKGINSVSEVFALRKLKRLLLLDSGDIESIKGIENLTELEEFFFYESTNIVDGDISPLLNLKKLKSISFQNRRHYTHRREDFGKLYASE